MIFSQPCITTFLFFFCATAPCASDNEHNVRRRAFGGCTTYDPYNKCPSGQVCKSGSCFPACQAYKCSSGRCLRDGVTCAPETAQPSSGNSNSNGDSGGGGGMPKSKSQDNAKTSTSGKFKPCFHASSEVMLPDGSTKRIDEVELGDKIASIDDKGELVYADVVFLPHLKNEEEAEFLELNCQTDEDKKTSSILVTRNHFLFVREEQAAEGSFEDANALPARRIKLGDWLLVKGESGNLETCAVQNIDTVDDSGVYTAFTANGRLLVNGIVASSYAERIDGVIDYGHDFAHSAVLFHRIVYQIGGAGSSWFRSLNEHVLAPLFA